MGRKLKLYKRIRNALLATNNKTINSNITACHIAMPIAGDKGVPVESKGITKTRTKNQARFDRTGKRRNY